MFEQCGCNIATYLPHNTASPMFVLSYNRGSYSIIVSNRIKINNTEAWSPVLLTLSILSQFQSNFVRNQEVKLFFNQIKVNKTKKTLPFPPLRTFFQVDFCCRTFPTFSASTLAIGQHSRRGGRVRQTLLTWHLTVLSQGFSKMIIHKLTKYMSYNSNHFRNDVCNQY